MPEIEAAAKAGCQVPLMVRPGSPPQDNTGTTPVITSLAASAA
jgi:hypothetical protein